jgi:hypothetical protein
MIGRSFQALYQHYDCWAQKDCSYRTLQVKLGRHPDVREEQEERTEKIGTEIREGRKERETDVRQEERTERRGQIGERPAGTVS